MKKLCYVATVPAAVHAFLRPHIVAASRRYEITVVCDPTNQDLLKDLPARLVLVPIRRKPSPADDLLLLLRLWRLFRRERFDVVHSIMPKTGLIAMLASTAARIPLRIHTFTGQVWANKTGLRRFSMKSLDWLTGKLASTILVDGKSQRQFLVEQGVLTPGSSTVLGAGSICGVDPQRFIASLAIRQQVRDELGIPQEAPVALFVGRLTRDKGILDLAAAMVRVRQACPGTVLLLVGSEEDLTFEQLKLGYPALENAFYHVGFTAHPERYMAAADVYCLPSYREGFPLSVIEAGASGVPAVASDIYGIADTIEDGKTGLLVPPGDIGALSGALLRLLLSPALRQSMGKAARQRVLESFESTEITREMVRIYDQFANRH